MDNQQPKKPEHAVVPVGLLGKILQHLMLQPMNDVEEMVQALRSVPILTDNVAAQLGYVPAVHQTQVSPRNSQP